MRGDTERSNPYLNYVKRVKTVPRGLLLTLLIGLHFIPVSFSLEATIGKKNTIEALNGTDVLLPCTFATCMGFMNLKFWWTRENNGTSTKLFEGMIRKKDDDVIQQDKADRIEFAGGKGNNISIILKAVDFEDTGKYACHVLNPLEKNLEHEAVAVLTVLSELKVVDNTLTVIIVSAIGGLIGLTILIMVTKKVIIFIMKKAREKNVPKFIHENCPAVPPNLMKLPFSIQTETCLPSPLCDFMAEGYLRFNSSMTWNETGVTVVQYTGIGNGATTGYGPKDNLNLNTVRRLGSIKLEFAPPFSISGRLEGPSIFHYRNMLDREEDPYFSEAYLSWK
ncbi:sodium channel, voltage-gated, type IV, beta a isoform X2 [Latimeria chalumnae]|uniref:sodium channel, voltage-gated, type IV, beta a isoform X2 n=1 Tax=Latimeria chalumnae TaxID=7897 RepID=UPI0003C141D7|nr:PREDICTED: sodium channel subunit beta-4 isoform X2 [Latimeria chalumnae]|eukprot:XP_005987305.1 PREDICTED: sodium channel subunit beta-4 isoform X2 [Latimeria chalumnae]